MLAGVRGPGLAAPAMQGSGILVSNSIFNREVVPGQTYVHTMDVSVPPDSPPLEITVRAMGMGQTLEGSVQPLEPEKDVSPYSALSAIVAVDQSQFQLEPGQSRQVNVTIAVPPDLKDEGRYALVHIGTRAPADRAVAFQVAVDVPIILNPKGGIYRETGAITDLRVSPVVSGQPIVVDAVVTNTGNHHYKAQAQVRILDQQGRVVVERTTRLSEMSIVPTFARRFRVTFGLLDQPQGLPVGRYVAEAVAIREDGTTLDIRRTEFEIAAPYVPFPGLSERDVFIQHFVAEEPGCVDARAVASVEVCFADTGVVTGTVAVGRYEQEPPGTAPLAAPQSEGGLGKQPIAFAGLRVDGFDRGTAQVKWHYDEDRLNGVSAHSLLQAYWNGQAWMKLDDLAVFTGANAVQGQIRVAALTGAPVIALAGDGGATGQEWQMSRTMLLAIGAIVVLAVALVVTLGLLLRRRSHAPS